MKVLLFVLFFSALAADGQVAYSFASVEPQAINADAYFNNTSSGLYARKLFQRNRGIIIGLQKGKFTSIELGVEAHWRKISLLKPHIIGATANMEYNFENNVIGYKAGMWAKRGRINLTYGANIGYFTNFKDGNRFGFGPSVGFRLLGLHLINGYNFLTKGNTGPDEKPIEVNSLYMSIRYYFPIENSFTWDRKTMKKKRERKKERARRKKEREKMRESGDSKSIWNIFKKKKDSE
jgi:hypothetical protein